MTLKRIWQERAASSFKAPQSKQLTKVEQDFLDALGRSPTVIGDYHAYVHFNDGTSYCVCRRYRNAFAQVAGTELKRCAALTVPTLGESNPPPDLMCAKCAAILRDELHDYYARESLKSRLIWRDVITGVSMQAFNIGAVW